MFVESVTFTDLPQDMAVLEVMVLNGTTTAAVLMTPPATVQDTNPHISRRRTLTPPATPTPPAIPTPGKVMAVVRRKPGALLAAMEEATIHTAAPDKVVTVEEAIVVKVTMKNIVVKRTVRKKADVRSTTRENATVRRTVTARRHMAPRG